MNETPPKLKAKRLINPKDSPCYLKSRILFFRDKCFTIKVKYLERYKDNIGFLYTESENENWKKITKKTLIKEYKDCVKNKYEDHCSLYDEEDFEGVLGMFFALSQDEKKVISSIKSQMDYTYSSKRKEITTREVVFIEDPVKERIYIRVEGKNIGFLKGEKADLLKTYEKKFVSCRITISGGETKSVKEIIPPSSFSLNIFNKNPPPKITYKYWEDFVPYSIELDIVVRL